MEWRSCGKYGFVSERSARGYEYMIVPNDAGKWQVYVAYPGENFKAVENGAWHTLGQAKADVEEREAQPRPVTVRDLVLRLLGRDPDDVKDITLQECASVGFRLIGGCSTCGATVSIANACPSHEGTWKCLHGCIGSDGWDDIELCLTEIENDGV